MELSLRQMDREDVGEVMRIERSIYPHPWTVGNFTDSLDFRYVCKVAELDGVMIGYSVLMPSLEEAHLLTIGIAAEHQRKGIGGELLGRMMAIAHDSGMCRVILEVRPSNTAALALYRKGGFRQIGLRRGYYPADNNGREDAIVMEYTL
ncbi:MAG TPA: ribosomal protein S18-alanine N-acetyltransferase [Gallionellaceae bacterium]|nr:ribosomal protein S18-alanine N-acetyltransferase [Gallionellaceae bacterium]